MHCLVLVLQHMALSACSFKLAAHAHATMTDPSLTAPLQSSCPQLCLLCVCVTYLYTDVMESTFLVLDTLALANRDVSAVVGQQRMNALSSLLLQLPMDQLLQQQTLGLAWINNMTSAVNRSKQLLESMAAGPDQSQAGQAVPAGQANLLQAAGGK